MIPPLAGNVGSGNAGTPCVRMHWAWAISAAFMLELTPGLPFGDRMSEMIGRHDFIAAVTTGDCMLMETGNWIAPIELAGPLMVAPGSGKPETPWARMHSENASASPVRVAGDAAPGFDAAPQPASSPQTPATATNRVQLTCTV